MNTRHLPRILRALVGLILLVGVLLVATQGAAWWPTLKEAISQQGGTAFLIFLAAFVGLTALCFPVSVLGFTAGALYGPWLGVALVFPAGLLSGSLMFLLGKGILRGTMHQMVNRDARLAAMEHLASRQAVRLNLLARLSPINFGVVSYALSSGQSSFRAYFIGMLASLPSVLLQVWIGALVGQGGQLVAGEGQAGQLRLVGMGIGVIFLIILSWQISRLVRQALAEAKVPARENQDTEAPPSE